MTGRFYSDETEYQERIRKRNERKRAYSAMAINSAIALGGSALADLVNSHLKYLERDLWWFFFTFVLICTALAVLNEIEAER